MRAICISRRYHTIVFSMLHSTYTNIRGNQSIHYNNTFYLNVHPNQLVIIQSWLLSLSYRMYYQYGGGSHFHKKILARNQSHNTFMAPWRYWLGCNNL